MRAANQLVGKTLGELAKHIAPGVNTLQLDKIAEEFIRDNGAVPAFLGYGGFPNSICASVNEQVVHGIPSSKTCLLYTSSRHLTVPELRLVVLCVPYWKVLVSQTFWLNQKVLLTLTTW